MLPWPGLHPAIPPQGQGLLNAPSQTLQTVPPICQTAPGMGFDMCRCFLWGTDFPIVPQLIVRPNLSMSISPKIPPVQLSSEPTKWPAAKNNGSFIPILLHCLCPYGA